MSNYTPHERRKIALFITILSIAGALAGWLAWAVAWKLFGFHF